MAVWFATANGTIDSAGRWNSLPNGTGTTLTWPPASNDVLMLNGLSVTINVNTTVAEIRNDTANGATAGGSFTLNNGIAITANGYMGSSGSGLILFSAATGTITGDYYGGTGNGSNAILASGTGTLTVTGTLYGGASGTNNAGIRNSGTGTVNITGNAIATDANMGVRLSAGGTVTISGYVQASLTGAGATSEAQGVLQVGETRSASNGRGAVTGAFRFASTTAAKSLPIIAGTQKTLSVLNVAALVPAVEDVRAGVVYGDGAYTGTLPLQRKRPSMAGRF